MALASEMQDVWGTADGLYRASTYIAYEIGREVARASSPHGPRLTALLGAHGRAVRVAGEIRLLAMNGFDTGAIARWRSLHDLAVLCAVLNDADEAIAKRYHAYAHIERYKDLLVYQEHAPKLGYTPHDESDMSIAKANYESVRQTYGPEMSKPQGWAFPLFPDSKKVDFADLEELAGLSHLRPFYKLGNNFIHAGARAADLNIRVDPNTGPKSINTGATVFADIAETCHGAMISLHQATASLVMSYFKEAHDGTVDLLVGLQTQSNFVHDGGTEWAAAADQARSRGWFTHTPSGGGT